MWHFAWFAKNIPDYLLTNDMPFTIRALPKDEREILFKMCRQHPQLAGAFTSEKDLVQVDIDLEAPTRDAAFEIAIKCARQVVDTYSLLSLNPASLLKVLVVYKRGDAKATLEVFDFDSTARAYVGDSATEIRAVRAALLDPLSSALMFAVSDGYNTELAEKLRAAVKMFGHGRRADDVQVQYLCRFTAVEALVCGSVLHGRGKLLIHRVPLLFATCISTSQIENLWKLRCGASHEGAGDWRAFAHALPEIDSIAIGCLLFASAHVQSVGTIDALWERAATYKVPAGVIQTLHRVVYPIQKMGCVLAELEPSALGLEALHGNDAHQ